VGVICNQNAFTGMIYSKVKGIPFLNDLNQRNAILRNKEEKSQSGGRVCNTS
jgi:hypothetical protein